MTEVIDSSGTIIKDTVHTENTDHLTRDTEQLTSDEEQLARGTEQLARGTEQLARGTEQLTSDREQNITEEGFTEEGFTEEGFTEEYTDNDSTLFIFYTLTNTRKPHFWAYSEKILDETGWSWIGSGSTLPLLFDLNIPLPDCPYSTEEQFNGPLKTRETVRSYLGSVLYNLQSRGIVSRYKISNSFDPFSTVSTPNSNNTNNTNNTNNSTTDETTTLYHLISSTDKEILSTYKDIAEARENAIILAQDYILQEPEYNCFIHEEGDTIQVIGFYKYYPLSYDRVLFELGIVRE